ncbi:MAG: TetR/AcrR family transcriptional regulator, partial [Actinobacteria bacterium]|nr:TetR/AcrR family transcriptional regulator [Actinomycetota bacterium]
MKTRTSTSGTGADRSRHRGAQLLYAAERLFTRQGVAATTVSDITGAAGVAKGTFYLYFDSKEQLLGTLKERFIEGMVDVVAEATGDVEP